MQSVNPKNNQVIAQYDELTEPEIELAVEQSHQAFLEWRTSTFEARAAILKRAADELEQRKSELAKLMADEMGKPLAEGVSEVEKCAWVCRYYAEHGAQQLADKPIKTEFSVSKISFQPIGCVFAVMPWNYPFWQVFRFAAPTLMAGNTALLKHAGNVSGCALEIASIFAAAGLPEHCFSTLLIGQKAAKAVIENPLVRAVTLTGSTGAGKSVAATAGGVLKKCVLELGGSDAYLVLADANVDQAVEKCAQSRLLNGGQSCISAKRFLVHESLVADFTSKLLAYFDQQVLGDPLDDATTIGPMARSDLRDELHDQVLRSIDAGAECLLGGQIPDREGAYYPPTILSSVTPGMPAFDEELFGPVAAIISVKSTEQAVQWANQSNFGLGGAIFSADIEQAERIATQQIDAGACFVNDFVKSDPRLPFGGVKDSGYGRELREFGIHEFVNIKSVCVQASASER
ncbi:NAD-dependent succinate-semialdehyde dehydrogenase [Arenicella xantha]|uniref:Succinate-semialdehyde dehydrogenase/glutarate-semialdehyde dehydrogenase n=1 Tax=Arenicella xantha TaxID=644221 RepID=A0A395JFY2_9GAMM|nr:NAD-dependent succinate-semialdehyde dehydrogenase [Arenicella xantha]RBP48713.1 succinate-semialdehyde dehydrogenase/glutarate-semialdehyde dehydrogenase [Arenicella xantha]